MTKVFIGGSRRVSQLDAQVRKRLDNITLKNFCILVGDASGADKAVQLYLHRKNYQNVEVFCTEGACRNNIGNWKLRAVPAATRERNAEFYSAKDRVMAKEATIGLMLWDGKSIGTLMNIHRLLSLHKKAVVYSVPDKEFTEFRTSDQWDLFIAHRESSIQEKLKQRASLETTSRKASGNQQSLFEPS
jgi:hypothetical protein